MPLLILELAGWGAVVMWYGRWLFYRYIVKPPTVTQDPTARSAKLLRFHTLGNLKEVVSTCDLNHDVDGFFL
jgi:hypothetical protein